MSDRDVTHVITGLETGGAEVLLVRLLKRLPEGPERGAVIALRGPGSLTQAVEELGVPVRHLGLRNVPGLRDIARIERALADTGGGVVQTWLIHGNVLGGLAARRAGRPVAWGVHSAGFTRGSYSFGTVAFQAAERRLSRRIPNAIVACSDSAEEFMRSTHYDTSRMSVIHNGFDLGEFHPDPSDRAAVREELGIGADEPVVGHVGRFHPVKDHRSLLAAAEQVIARVPDARFVLAGKGVTRENLDLARWSEPLGDAVIMLGERSDAPRLYRAFDVTVLSSASTEALPLVIGEAMASGSPVVSTDCGDASALVGETGRIVPPSAPGELADALSELLELPPERRSELAIAARQRIAEHYSLDAMVAAYRALWDDLADGA